VPLNSGGFVLLNSERIVPTSPLEDSLEDVFPSILGGTACAPSLESMCAHKLWDNVPHPLLGTNLIMLPLN